MKLLKNLSLSMVLLGAGLAFPPEANSYSPYLDQVVFQYKKPYSCNLCHQPQQLTTFGKDFRQVLEKTGMPNIKKALKQLEKIDSDKDGWLNKEELNAGCLPQDPLSYPQSTQNNANCLKVHQ